MWYTEIAALCGFSLVGAWVTDIQVQKELSMNNRLRKFPLRSMLSLVLFGALVGVLATAAAPLTPLLAEPAIQEAPTVQIRTPEKGALITQSAGTVLTISGFAWDSTNNPGFPNVSFVQIVAKRAKSA